MPNPYFQFKQFTIYHDLCAMKVGVDGVLLGAWAPLQGDEKQILDVGCGSGLITLFISQRSKASITGIDIDKQAVMQSLINIDASLWTERINIYESSLQDFKPAADSTYDLIVSNPPYFVNSLKTPDQARNLARHADSLSTEDLLTHANRLLNNKGRICLILPLSESMHCVKCAEKINLYCQRRVVVYPKPGKPAKRVLLELSKVKGSLEESELFIETESRHSYSPEFTALLKDFYLKL